MTVKNVHEAFVPFGYKVTNCIQNRLAFHLCVHPIQAYNPLTLSLAQGNTTNVRETYS